MKKSTLERKLADAEDRAAHWERRCEEEFDRGELEAARLEAAAQRLRAVASFASEDLKPMVAR